MDYCNGLLTGHPKKTIRQLQLIQNAAARILTRILLNGLGPKYIADMLTEYKPNRPLRSVGSSWLEIPRVHTKQGESYQLIQLLKILCNGCITLEFHGIFLIILQK